jgi:hypothetical protein
MTRDTMGGPNVIGDDLSVVGGQTEFGGGTGVYEFMGKDDRDGAAIVVLEETAAARGGALLTTATGGPPSNNIKRVAKFIMAFEPIDIPDGSGGGVAAQQKAVHWAVELFERVAGHTAPATVTEAWVGEKLDGMAIDQLLVLGSVFGVERPRLRARRAGTSTPTEEGGGEEAAQSGERDDERAAAAEGELMMMRLHLRPAILKAIARPAGGVLGAAVGGGGGGGLQVKQHDFKAEVELQQAVAATRSANAFMRPRLSKMWRSLQYVQEQGWVPEPVIDIEESALVLPGATLALHQTMRRHEFAAQLLANGIANSPNSGILRRGQNVIANLDALFLEGLKDKSITWRPNQWERVHGYFNPAAVLMACLNNPSVAFHGDDPANVKELYEVAEALSFLSVGEDSILLTPGVPRVTEAMDAVEANDDAAAIDHVDVRRVCDALARACGEAIRDPRVNLQLSGTTFRDLALTFIRDLRSFTTENPSTAVPISKLHAVLQWLNSANRLQQREEADVAAVTVDGDRQHSLAVNALQLKMEQRIIAQSEVGVQAIRLLVCELSPGCSGQHRPADPLCSTCNKWKEGWICSKCGFVSKIHLEECHDFKCSGLRPRLPLPPGAIPGQAQVAAQKQAYAKRDAYEEKRAARLGRN